MEDFEQQLKDALERQDPPEGFAHRVMARAAALDAAPRRSWRWVAGIAAAVMIAGGVGWQHERETRERAAGEQAKARLQLALKITRVKLSKIVETAYTHPAEGE